MNANGGQHMYYVAADGDRDEYFNVQLTARYLLLLYLHGDPLMNIQLRFFVKNLEF